MFADFLHVPGRAHARPGRAVQLEIKFARCFPLTTPYSSVTERIATGHYARCGRWATWPRKFSSCSRPRTGTKGSDRFLYRLSQGSSPRRCSPLGALATSAGAPDRRRGRAARGREEGLHRHLLHRRRPFREFLMRYLPTRPGRDPRARRRPRARRAPGPDVPHHQPAQRASSHRRPPGPPGRDGRTRAWAWRRRDVQANVLYVVPGHAHPRCSGTTWSPAS